VSLIRLEKVTKEYRLGQTYAPALRGVDIEIGAGEFVAVWGPSGSGKSTLCNLIGVIDTPTAGRVTVNGRDVSELSDDERSDHRNQSVGFIFQQFNLMQVLSSVENVMLPLTIRGEPNRTARQKALALLEELDLSPFIHSRPDKMSGGQRQRVAIARALVSNPPLVIADEPTANLDSENATKIVDLMRGFNHSRGTTFLFATHDQRLLARVSRLVRLEDGLIKSDTRQETPREPAGRQGTA
jgi:putative ABC transport system ATP-binding protein